MSCLLTYIFYLSVMERQDKSYDLDSKEYFQHIFYPPVSSQTSFVTATAAPKYTLRNFKFFIMYS
jgi:hypothetical protein